MGRKTIKTTEIAHLAGGLQLPFLYWPVVNAVFHHSDISPLCGSDDYGKLDHTLDNFIYPS